MSMAQAQKYEAPAACWMPNRADLALAVLALQNDAVVVASLVMDDLAQIESHSF